MKLETIALMVKLSKKLTATSFGAAWKDYSVYRFVKDNRLMIPYDFLENEKDKLFKKYGEWQEDGSIVIRPENVADYKMAMEEILNQEINDYPILNLTSNDFEECLYSDNKNFWLCADDIAIIETYLMEQKKRED